ncbi:MAG: protein-L-isoaspartate(D-aspartate) O-methyltransferase [Gammaproteobacteria bacterium]|nr:protein-L-isoaspartate(D-aspartate) O-methyltransferase [Gammaproteobacteria bacterium]MYF52410.1 protein-L-isoaspartate(D-aspartate) O-methyltransferase [Gammaproteobacteria bacterium]MYK43513.1 protein-L-isoaspartate(D-aspartate) O-methyltransferase [Gammaproteobacteria bacterium]
MKQGVGLTSLSARQRLTASLAAKGISNDLVLSAIETVPRHLFVDPSIGHLAYEDMALPIGQRQTISQPYVVALMSQAVVEIPNVKSVLEIGTGCGYQAAILSQLVAKVYSIERVHSLALDARLRLQDLKYSNIWLKYGDGQEGWAAHAPFDCIIITASTRSIPSRLKSQLADNGKIIAPKGHRHQQSLVVMERKDDQWQEKKLAPVVFVPLLSGTQQE